MVADHRQNGSGTMRKVVLLRSCDSVFWRPVADSDDANAGKTGAVASSCE